MFGLIACLFLASANAFSPCNFHLARDQVLRMRYGSEDETPLPRGISSSELRQVNEATRRRPGDRNSRFLQGDDLHKLRQHILSLRNDLEVSRERGYFGRVHELEQAILFAQNLDAEFVYTTSMERSKIALQVGDTDVAKEFRTQAKHARNALPQFNLDGLWVGNYDGDHLQMINVTYSGDTLVAYKVTGDENIPKGEVSFAVDLSLEAVSEEVLEPIQLADTAASQWGSQFLQRFVGKGQVAESGFGNPQWLDGQLILVNEYFSFAWIPRGEQVFFGRPSAELTLKLLRSDRSMSLKDDDIRTFLERCFQETEEVQPTKAESILTLHDQNYYYAQDGCFE